MCGWHRVNIRSDQRNVETTIESLVLSTCCHAGELVVHAGQRRYVGSHGLASLVFENLAQLLAQNVFGLHSSHASKGRAGVNDEEWCKGKGDQSVN